VWIFYFFSYIFAWSNNMTIFSYPKSFMSWSLWLSPQASGIGNHIYVMMVMIRSNETNLIWNKFFSNLSLTMSHGGLKENACKMIDDISTKTKEIHWVDFIKSIHSQVYKMGYELTKTMHWNLSLLAICPPLLWVFLTLEAALVLFALSKHCLEREVRGSCGSCNSLTVIHIYSNPGNDSNMLCWRLIVSHKI